MSSAPQTSEAITAPEATQAEIDASCRLPLLLIFCSAATWLVISGILGLIASVKMHGPEMLADCRFFTYGHVQAGAFNTLLYGFVAQAAIGVMLWLIARLGRTTLVNGGFATVGAIFWNLGVTLGLIGIMIGDGSGYEWFEFPKYASAVLLAGYFLMGAVGGFTFAERKNTEMYPSQWFLLAALFWFPWIYLTAVALLHWMPVAGVMQAVVHQWFAHNLVTVWLGSIGIAAAFYFIPKISGRPLGSYYHALATFWLWLLFGSMGGMHHGMPVPAWLPTLSTVMAFLLVIPVISFAVALYGTLFGGGNKNPGGVEHNLIFAGALALILGVLLKAVGSAPEMSETLHFTYFTAAQARLMLYGFASFTLFGAIYYIVPRLTGREWPVVWAVKFHFFMALIGVVFLVGSLVAAGAIQGAKLSSLTNFSDVTKVTMRGFRMSTVGDLLWLLGAVAFLVNLKLVVFKQVTAQAKVCLSESKDATSREATV